MVDEKQKAHDERLMRGLQSDVPVVYANGFLNTLGTGDVLSVLERNGQPACVLNMSYTVAKTYALSLLEIIRQLEELSGQEIMTTKNVETLASEENK